MSPELIFSIGTLLSFPLIMTSVLFGRRQIIQYLFGNSELTLFQLIRRLLGVGLTISIAIMLFFGSNAINMPAKPIDFINFWSIWLLLVLILVVVLIWDWVDTQRTYFRKKRQYQDDLMRKTFGNHVKKIELNNSDVVYINEQELAEKDKEDE